MEITVLPEALTSAGGRLSQCGAQVEGAAATLRAAGSGVPGACGFPEAGGPFEDLAASWHGAIGRCADGISGLGGMTSAAGAIYEFVDATVIP